jgi:hypothetical protein
MTYHSPDPLSWTRVLTTSTGLSASALATLIELTGSVQGGTDETTDSTCHQVVGDLLRLGLQCQLLHTFGELGTDSGLG